jgi:hypothetical protein
LIHGRNKVRGDFFRHFATQRVTGKIERPGGALEISAQTGRGQSSNQEDGRANGKKQFACGRRRSGESRTTKSYARWMKQEIGRAVSVQNW